VAAAQRLPVAAVTIYPGDIIRDNMLADHDFPDQIASDGFINRRADLVGKVAKRTLLPGQAISSNSVALPKLVTIGAMVKLVFEEGGLTISTYASALQAGAAGDLISVRNVESGLILTGVIAPDGSIHVSNG
jgi:flagella basal body P-ring formation protein FlgA